MDIANQIKQSVRDIVPKPIQHIYLAEVLDIQTDTCTVRAAADAPAPTILTAFTNATTQARQHLLTLEVPSVNH